MSTHSHTAFKPAARHIEQHNERITTISHIESLLTCTNRRPFSSPAITSLNAAPRTDCRATGRQVSQNTPEQPTLETETPLDVSPLHLASYGWQLFKRFNHTDCLSY